MRKAFTLVEILTTMAIIVVLAGILFSALSSSVAASKKTICISNLHQIQVAMTLYKNDAGEYPAGEASSAFLPYLGGTLLTCPYTDTAQYQDPPEMRVNYFLNGYTSFLSPAELECRITRGSEYPLVYDGNHASPLVARSVGKPVYLFARVDGSVAVEDYNQAFYFEINPSVFPCPKASMFSNLK